MFSEGVLEFGRSKVPNFGVAIVRTRHKFNRTFAETQIADARVLVRIETVLLRHFRVGGHNVAPLVPTYYKFVVR